MTVESMLYSIADKEVRTKMGRRGILNSLEYGIVLNY